MTWVSVALAGLVGMAEASAVIQEATPTGQYPASALFGFGQATAPLTAPTAVLHSWAIAAVEFGDLPGWLCVYLGFSLLFVAGYCLLGLTVLPRTGLAGRWMLPGLVVVTLLQDGIALLVLLIWIRQRRDVPAVFAWLLHGVVILKWAVAIALLVSVAYWAWRTDNIRNQICRIARAFKVQRFSAVIVALLGVLAISRGSDVLEQLPDVQRAWLTWPPSKGWVHLTAAVTAQGLLAFLLVYLGRLRVKRAVVAYTDAPDRRVTHRYWPWLLIPVVLLAVTVILRFIGAAQVSWFRVIPIPLVMWGIAAASFLSSRRDAPDPRIAPTPNDPETVDTVRTVGDLLAVAVIAVTGLGLVRSFTAPALVVGGGYSVVSWSAVAVGVAVAAGSWAVAYGPVRRVARRLVVAGDASGWHPLARMAHWASAGEAPTGRSLWPALAAMVPLLAADVMLIFVPLWATHWLGVLATTVIALGTLTVGLAILAFLAQSRIPLPLFRLLGLKVTPVITLIAIIAVVGAELDKNSVLHEVRGPAHSGQTSTAASPNGKTDLLSSLHRWLADPATTSCAVPAPASTAPGAQEIRVEPLVLVAGAGGGIRAAWWTAHALARLAATPCGQHAIFAVSSVSGSSLGLTILATTPHPDAAISRIAGPDALAAAIDGLLLRDLVAGTTGLNLIAAQMPSGQKFPDRAALMESAWEAEDSALTDPFPLSQPVLPWQLLLNATAVRTGCRAIIADQPIGPAIPTVAPSLTCGPGSAAPAADSYDLFAALPCLKGIHTATAALLGARFPYITPSGVVNGCEHLSGTSVEQFVDGGYADSSGLSTLADLAPALMTAVRQYNTTAVARTPASQPVTLVVPVTAYLGNSPQPEPIAGTVPPSPPEPLIPLTSAAASAQTQLISSTASLQRLAAETSTTQLFSCPPGDTRCTKAEAAAAATVPNQLILVVPRTQPRVAAPLGWVLSQASRNALDTALQQEAAHACGPHTHNLLYCPVGVGQLDDLLRLTHDAHS